MSSKILTYKKLPSICKTCPFLDSDANDEYSRIYYYCKYHTILPVKKNTCKIREMHEQTKEYLND